MFYSHSVRTTCFFYISVSYLCYLLQYVNWHILHLGHTCYILIKLMLIINFMSRSMLVIDITYPESAILLVSTKNHADWKHAGCADEIGWFDSWIIILRYNTHAFTKGERASNAHSRPQSYAFLFYFADHVTKRNKGSGNENELRYDTLREHNAINICHLLYERWHIIANYKPLVHMNDASICINARTTQAQTQA